MHCKQLSWYDVSTTLKIYRSDIGLQHDPHVVIVVVFIYFISMGTEIFKNRLIRFLFNMFYRSYMQFFFIIRFNLFLFNIQHREHQVQKQILKFILNSASPFINIFSLCFLLFCSNSKTINIYSNELYRFFLLLYTTYTVQLYLV